MLHKPLLFVTLALALLPGLRAEETAPPTTLLGVGGWSRPAYDGSAAGQTLAPIPVIRHYGRPWFARTTFGVLEGGARAELVRGLTVGAQLAYEGGRDEAESSFLAAHRLPNLPASMSWGLHVELEQNVGPMPLIALLRYRQDVDAQRGAQADLRLTAGLYSGGGFNAGIFLQGTWADGRASQYYYGITPQLAAGSGLAAFDAQGGPLFHAQGLLGSYDLGPQWLLLASLEWRQLRGTALDSPLVQQSGSRYASLGLAYRF